MNNAQLAFAIQSTAGAVPVKNEKGEVSMQKVKVHRYVSGKRPDYAPASSSDEESEDEDFSEQQSAPVARPSRPTRRAASPTELFDDTAADDPRLRRLMTHRAPRDESDGEDRMERHRHIHEPEVLDMSEEEMEMETEPIEPEPRKPIRIEADSGQSEDEEDLSDEEIERRRRALKQKLLAQKQHEEPDVMIKEEENRSADESEEESSEYEEESDSEEEAGPRLKPVFVRKKDRITVLEKEKEILKEKQAEIDAKKMAEERKRHTLRMVEDIVRKETAVSKDGEEQHNIADINTDDENDEVEYEAWKLRELKRIKRDREEREALEKERGELERIRTLTEEERRLEFRNNPKVVTNRSTKGKYKFLQKYYHRGAFYLDNEENVLKRDFSAATLEDHFDKTILPKVMQVKNFGRSGRTKYTHLVDQDTTQFESPWVSETAQNNKFYSNNAAGMKQAFEKPSMKTKRSQQLT